MKPYLLFVAAVVLLTLSACDKPIIISPDAVLPDGSSYKGELKDGTLHGKGTLLYPEGAYYKGEFRDGSFNGQGVYVDTHGIKYEGDFSQGKFEGQGKLLDAQGNSYEGGFVNWQYAGSGVLDYAGSGKYQGEFKAGQYHGQGKFARGDVVYEGVFVDGELQGKGSHIAYDGSTYTGEFKNWLAHGAGIKINPDGKTIAGSFESGYAEGQGKITWPDGSVYTGNIEFDKAEGNGVLQYADGRIYEGEFSYGTLHGEGTLTIPATQAQAEQVQTGIWSRGKLIHDTNSGERMHSQAELALEQHQTLLQGATNEISTQDPSKPDLYFIGVAGDGSQSVFKREIEFVKPLIEQRYGSANKTTTLINHHDTAQLYPMATRRSIATVIDAVAKKMDTQQDLLFMYLTSHGSKNHEFYLNHDSIKLPPLSAQELAKTLEQSRIKWKVIVISACYAGGFIPALADDHTLVIAAADADSRSFGCSEEADMTYFGRALFSEALSKSPQESLAQAFSRAKALVSSWEQEQEKDASNPQIHAPDGVLKKLAELRQQNTL